MAMAGVPGFDKQHEAKIYNPDGSKIHAFDNLHSFAFLYVQEASSPSEGRLNHC
jgi:hypothetical protein